MGEINTPIPDALRSSAVIGSITEQKAEPRRLNFTPLKDLITRTERELTDKIRRTLRRLSTPRHYDKKTAESTFPIRFDIKYTAGGIEEFEALSRLYQAAPEYVACPIRVIEQNGAVIGYRMEYVEGITASDYEDERGSLPPEIAQKIRRAVEIFQQKGLAHGDINANNVIITPNGEIRFIDPVGYGEIPPDDLDKYLAYDRERLEHMLRDK